MDCPLCAKVSEAVAGKNPSLVRDFGKSLLILGDHQFFKGACVLAWKDHVREPHELSEADQQALMRDLTRAGKALQGALRPWKLNYSCFGNQVPHLHWHLFPRYETDPDRLDHPWLHSSEFAKRPTTDADRAELLPRLRSQL